MYRWVFTNLIISVSVNMIAIDVIRVLTSSTLEVDIARMYTTTYTKPVDSCLFDLNVFVVI